MNRLKELRGEQHQADFAKSLGIPYIDGPMLSRIEKGYCNPTPEDAQIIADKFGVTVADIWPTEELAYSVYAPIPIKPSHTFANGSGNENYSIVTRHIPIGKKYAISRKILTKCTGLSDRHNRELIADARHAGNLIISTSKGYYRPDDMRDVVQYYYQELHRGQAIWIGLSPIRKWLDKHIPGQMPMVSFCLRSGDPIQDGMYCWSCEQKIDRRSAATETSATKEISQDHYTHEFEVVNGN